MSLRIVPARPEHVPAVVAMIHELAEFERAAELCRITDAHLHTALFRPGAAVYAHVALLDDTPVGMAVWFLNFSTWTGGHGVYLEDLYVSPAARGTGAGKALLAALAAICVERGYERLEWAVLDWNPAREFYDALGARPKDDWVPYRLAGEPLAKLAASATGDERTAARPPRVDSTP